MPSQLRGCGDDDGGFFFVRKAMSDLALDLNAVDLTSYPSALHLI